MQNVYFRERTFDSDSELKPSEMRAGTETNRLFPCGPAGFVLTVWLCFLLTKEGMLSDALLAGTSQSIVRC